MNTIYKALNHVINITLLTYIIYSMRYLQGIAPFAIQHPSDHHDLETVVEGEE